MLRTQSNRSKKNARRLAPVALLCALGAATAFAASGPPAPTLTSSPAAVTRSTSATFNYSAGQSGVTFKCTLDGAAKTCPVGSSSGSATTGSVTFAGLASATHTFVITTIDSKSRTSGDTSYTWTVDTVAPTLDSITRSGATPTKAASASWVVTFSEAVGNVGAGNFSIAQTGLTGTPAITSVSGSGRTWNVTASTGNGTTGATGTLGLSFSSKGSISDAAGNAIATATPVSGPAYTIDKTAPSIAWTDKPADPSSTATARFAWVQSPADPDFDHYECSTENGPYATCSSPFLVDTSNNGQHQYAVRAWDTAGNSSVLTYSWKVQKGSIQDFVLRGNVAPGDRLYPGGASRAVPVELVNPNSMPIYVTAVSAVVDTAGLPAGCQASWFTVTPSDVSATHAVTVPAGGSVVLPAQGVSAPRVALTESGTNQDACKGATYTLKYSGSAHS